MKRSLFLLTSATLLSISSLVSAPALASEPPPAAAAAEIAPPAEAAPAKVEPSHKDTNLALREAGITPEIAQKLTGDQLFQILRDRPEGTDQGGSVAIVVPLAFFLFLFLGVAAGIYLGVRKDRERQETLRAMIQRGGTIPPELLIPPVKKFSDLRRGIILISGGLGLSIFIGVMPTDRGVWSVGVIPMLLGAGYLLAWKLTRPDAAAQKSKDEAQLAAEREVNSL
jgi:hypothetical protein